MLWGCFSSKGHGNLVRIHGNMNQRCSQVIKCKSESSLKSLRDESESSLKSPKWCSLNNSMTTEIHHDCYANWRHRNKRCRRYILYMTEMGTWVSYSDSILTCIDSRLDSNSFKNESWLGLVIKDLWTIIVSAKCHREKDEVNNVTNNDYFKIIYIKNNHWLKHAQCHLKPLSVTTIATLYTVFLAA